MEKNSKTVATPEGSEVMDGDTAVDSMVEGWISNVDGEHEDNSGEDHGGRETAPRGLAMYRSSLMWGELQTPEPEDPQDDSEPRNV